MLAVICFHVSLYLLVQKAVTSILLITEPTEVKTCPLSVQNICQHQSHAASLLI